MKFFLSTIIIGLFCLISLPVLAVNTDLQTQTEAFAGQSGANFSPPKDPRQLTASVIQISLSVLGILTTIYLVYGGFTIVTSAGEEEKITTGKKTIVTAVIGLIIIFSAYAITKLAFSVATAGNEAVTENSE